MTQDSEYDVIIVGGGPAGLTAGLFATRHGRRVLVLSCEPPGGTLLNVPTVVDFPALLDGTPGHDIGPLIHQQASAAGAEFVFMEVDRILPDGDRWIVAAGSEVLLADAVVVASGTRAKRLATPGSEALGGKGISYCAACDGPLFRERVVGVVGGGDSGLSEALHLKEHAEKVIVFEQAPELPGHHALRRLIDASPAIDVRCNAAVEGVIGTDSVNGVQIREVHTGDVAEIELLGLFVNIGREPQTSFLDQSIGILDSNGRIQTDGQMQTHVSGLLAAGDVRSDAPGYAITACGDGAIAALSAHHYLARTDHHPPRS